MSIAVSDDSRLSEFRRQDAAIEEMKREYMPLLVTSPTDAVGLKRVHDARMKVKAARVAVEKLRKELKADSLEYGRRVDSEAKRITALIEPIEAHLEEQEAIVTREKERIKAEEAAKRKAIVDERLKLLLALGCMRHPESVALMTETEFASLVEIETAEKRKREEEAARLAEERRIKEEELAAERKRQQEELAAQRKQQQEEAARLAEERARIAAEQRKVDEQRRLVELEEARRVAAEKAKLETERRLAEQERLRIAAEEAERARLARIEAQRPHRERIRAFGESLLTLPVPDGFLLDAVLGIVSKASQQIVTLSENDE